MRFLVFGAGAIGGVVGGRLAHAGHDVTLLARGAHLDALRETGLRLESPDGVETLHLPTVADVAEHDFRDDVVLLAVKSQQTATALDALVHAAPPSTRVVCLQNGIANERAVLRHFANVYAVNVMCPASHLEPGVVQVWSAPVAGQLDIGRFPGGTDDSSDAVAAAFRSATFDSRSVADVWRWKLRKLVTNLVNVVEATCGPEARRSDLAKRLWREGEEVLAAAGLDVASRDEDKQRRGDVLILGEIEGRRRAGGSTWQSVQRRTGDVETDYLNGEIVLLGRLHGVPTPANELMQQLAREVADARLPAGSFDADELARQLDDQGSVRPTASD